jgi:hypothetical protein
MQTLRERIFIAVVFSLFYVTMYPILVGGFVIYVYPYWSPRAAIAWIAVGVMVQAWFCFTRPAAASGSSLRKQVGAGVLYAASIVVLSQGGCYQS